MNDDDLVDGRVRGRGPTLGIVVGLAVVAALWFGGRLIGGDGAASSRDPGPRVETGPTGGFAQEPMLAGRLVYTTFETSGPPERQQRLIVFDVASRTVREGPLVPSAEELWVAGGDRRTVVLVADDAGRGGVAYRVEGLERDAAVTRLARGDVLTLSRDGTFLLVGSSSMARTCEGERFDIRAVPVAEGGLVSLRPPPTCGRLVAMVENGNLTFVTVVRGRHVYVETAGRATHPVFDGLAMVSRSPQGQFILADPEGGVLQGLGVWPRTPTGRFLVWPRGGDPRSLVAGTRFFGQRVVAWSPDGGEVVVNGIVGGDRGMWLVYVAGGTAQPLLPPNSFPLRSAFSGAAFDDSGNVYAASPGTIVVGTAAGVFPLQLPAGAPSPVGPLVWLP